MSNVNDIKKLLLIFDKNFLSITPLIILFLIATLIDVLGIAIIAPYISFLLNPESLIIFEEIINVNLNNYDFKILLIIFSSFLIFIFFLKFIFALIIRYYIRKFTLNCRRDLQMKLLKTYQSMDYKSFSLRNSSDFIKNVI